MKLTILGNHGPFAGPDGACSGYLIETENTKIMLDCGTGASSNLQKVCRPEELDAIILSHFHLDHYADMLTFKHYIIQSRLRNAELPKDNIDVYCPEFPEKKFNEIDREAFNVNVIKEDVILSLKDCKITFCQTIHPIVCYAIKVENNGKKFVYSADSSYTSRLIDFSAGADLLLSDANYTSKDETGIKLVHLTAKENAQIANNAGVKKLLLTHFYPYDDTTIHLSEAKEVFKNVELSEILKTYEI